MLKSVYVFSFLSVLGMSLPAVAAAPASKGPQLMGEYKDWAAYFYDDPQGRVCYIASTPKKDEGRYTSRGDIYVVVTHRPNEKSYDVVNINAGYTYKKNAQVELKIGAKTFYLFTDGDKAWAMKDKDDKDIVAAMKRGSRMIVDGVSSRGTKTKDTYSLTGFTSAYKAISNKCK